MEKFLENLTIFLNSLPEVFLKDERKEIEKMAQKESLTNEEKKQVIKFAKKAYPYNFAYLEVFNECCRVKEEIGIHNFLKDEGAKSRFDKFLKNGGDIEKIRQGKVDEDYLGEDDIEKFKKAEADVHKGVHQDVTKRVEGVDREKFNEYLEEGKKRVEGVNAGVVNLRQMASELSEWNTEILIKVEEMEERWVNHGNEPTSEDLSELLEFYNSIQM